MSQIIYNGLMKNIHSVSRYLFSLGFRPFFLGAGVYAAWSLIAWLSVYLGGVSIPHIWDDGMVWHAHEMIYGFTAAVIGGFLLTAVPNWTKARPIRAWPLMVLFSLWLVGRLVMHCGSLLPWGIVAALDMVFLPAVGLSLLPAVIRGSSVRNYVFFVILAFMTLLNGFIHVGMQGYVLWLDAHQALRAALFLICLMITIFGGRVVPMFTRNALKVSGVDVVMRVHPLLEKASLGSVFTLVVFALIGQAESAWMGWLALMVGALHLFRLFGWHGHRTLRMPIVWVLHAGYGWIAFGFLAYGLALLVEPSFILVALHILTIGGIGTMTLAMMSRVSLGHTGHKLQAAKAVVAAYALLQVAVLVRIAGGLGWLDYTHAIALSGMLWSTTFALFSAVYLPILLRPRADGPAD